MVREGLFTDVPLRLAEGLVLEVAPHDQGRSAADSVQASAPRFMSRERAPRISRGRRCTGTRDCAVGVVACTWHALGRRELLPLFDAASHEQVDEDVCSASPAGRPRRHCRGPSGTTRSSAHWVTGQAHVLPITKVSRNCSGWRVATHMPIGPPQSRTIAYIAADSAARRSPAPPRVLADRNLQLGERGCAWKPG